MKRVITKRLREQAALICAVMASTPEVFSDYRSVGETIGADESTWDVYYGLAISTWHHAYRTCYRKDRNGDWTNEILDAEAESLLRTGFVPEGWRDA